MGRGLAAFPAFPDPATVNPFTLGFAPTSTSLSFALNGYAFAFSGDFSAAAVAMGTLVPSPFGDIPLFFAALSPLSPVQLPIRLDGAVVTRIGDGAPVIGFSGATSSLTLSGFLTTLLDPANYTDDIIAAFFGSTAAFTTFDLSAFSNPVVLGRPNASVTGPDGERGIVAYAQELDGFAFTEVRLGAGDDRLAGTDAAETFVGGAGDDLLLGRAGGDRLLGDAGRDVLSAGEGDDFLAGGAGDDVLAGGAGGNVLAGGTGADRFVIGAGPGRDAVLDFARAEGDLIDISALGVSARGLAVALAGATAGAAGLEIGFGARTLVLAGLASATVADFVLAPRAATAADQVLAAGPGNSWIDGGGGDDVVLGGDAASWLFGADGDDVVLGGAAADRIYGGAGADALDGGAGGDLIWGGFGGDVLFGAAGDDRLTGEAGDDFLDGGAGDDVIEGGLGTDALTGAAGRDTFVFAARDRAVDRVTDFELGLDLIDIRGLVHAPLTAENLAAHISATSPGPTHLTRFLWVDADGAGARDRPVMIAQFDNLDDAQLLAAANYLFG